MIIKLTTKGEREVKSYINELMAKRKEILDAGIDTADHTAIPTVKDILIDIDLNEGVKGEYCELWNVTDNYEADYPLCLMYGIDYIY